MSRPASGCSTPPKLFDTGSDRSNHCFGQLIRPLYTQGAVDRVATYVRQDRDNKDGRSDKKKQVNASEPRPGAESSMRLDQALYRYEPPSSPCRSRRAPNGDFTNGGQFFAHCALPIAGCK